ncbi:SRPBCC family protein [Saccharospirillum sp. HFRX-1]|uniref:SRPBCC family protein n=1 Tax=unclassified Saccharospirillum TaxID=2633430 RepID=UPI003716EBB5
MNRVAHVTISINAKPDAVYRYVVNPENLTAWAAGLAQSTIRQEGEVWIADAPFGTARIRFTPANTLGVLDHKVELDNGEVVNNPMRVIANGEGCEVMFTLMSRPGMTDAEFDADKAAIERDLSVLKSIFES